jgi:transposase
MPRKKSRRCKSRRRKAKLRKLQPQKSPPEKLFARAAELRAAGASWKSIAKEVNRAERTVYRWQRKFAGRWAEALVQAERRMTAQADCESVHTLRQLLLSRDEKVRWHAAKALIARRVDRDRIDLKTPPPPQHALSSEAAQLIAFLDGQPDEELSAIIELPAHADAPAA